MVPSITFSTVDEWKHKTGAGFLQRLQLSGEYYIEASCFFFVALKKLDRSWEVIDIRKTFWWRLVHIQEVTVWLIYSYNVM